MRHGLSVVQRDATAAPVETSETIQCPFCGQDSVVTIDTRHATQRFISDCEVCCRPFEVTVECEAGEILSLDVAPG